MWNLKASLYALNKEEGKELDLCHRRILGGMDLNLMKIILTEEGKELGLCHRRILGGMDLNLMKIIFNEAAAQQAQWYALYHDARECPFYPDDT